MSGKFIDTCATSSFAQDSLNQDDLVACVTALKNAGVPFSVTITAPLRVDNDGEAEFAMSMLGGYVNTSGKELEAASTVAGVDPASRMGTFMLAATNRATQVVASALNRAAAEGNSDLFKEILETINDLAHYAEGAGEEQPKRSVH